MAPLITHLGRLVLSTLHALVTLCVMGNIASGGEMGDLEKSSDLGISEPLQKQIRKQLEERGISLDHDLSALNAQSIAWTFRGLTSPAISEALKSADSLWTFVTHPSTPYVERRAAAMQGGHVLPLDRLPQLIAAREALRKDERYFGMKTHRRGQVLQSNIPVHLGVRICNQTRHRSMHPKCRLAVASWTPDCATISARQEPYRCTSRRKWRGGSPVALLAADIPAAALVDLLRA